MVVAETDGVVVESRLAVVELGGFKGDCWLAVGTSAAGVVADCVISSFGSAAEEGGRLIVGTWSDL